MSKFIWEPDEALLPGDAPIRPSTTSDLLKILGVEDAEQTVQYETVKAWLYANQPDPLLRVSLVQHGFAPDLTPSNERVKVWAGETFELEFSNGISLLDALATSVPNPGTKASGAEDDEVAPQFELVKS